MLLPACLPACRVGWHIYGHIYGHIMAGHIYGSAESGGTSMAQLDDAGWDHESTPPELPAEVVDGVLERYVEAFRRISGREPEL